MKLSIIIPALNEAGSIEQVLMSVRGLDMHAEVIVVDGGSEDNTYTLAQPLADQVIQSARGRARQMNAGATKARGKYLLFLHADTRLTPEATGQLQSAFDRDADWGRFDVRISGKPAMLKVVARLMNLRSRLSGIATGDQAMFIRRDLFESIGGFPDQPLMEDIELSRRLLKHSRPCCLTGPVTTSGRRWEQRGVWSAIGLMWRLRYRYWRGESAEQLAKEYR